MAAAAEQDVEQFLWDLEAALAHVDGDERLALVREAERLLHEEAGRLAAQEGSEDITWVHYVMATAEVGPPERLAAQLTGEPLPDRERVGRRLWVVGWSIVAVTAAVLLYALLVHGDLVEVGTWSGNEEARTGQETLLFNVSSEADRVFVTLFVAPVNQGGLAQVTILDGAADVRFQGTALPGEHLEVARYLEGAPGAWRVLVDFRDFTGGWRVQAREEL